MKSALRAWQQVVAPSAEGKRALEELDPATREVLRNLGYGEGE
jgi:hypothetical protein